MTTVNDRDRLRGYLDNWQYSGDVNVEYGGLFVNCRMADYRNGYLDATRVTDLDSGCGFTGAVLIEKVVVIVDKKRVLQALESCGWIDDTSALLKARGVAGKLQMIAEALIGYGHYDPREDYQNAQSIIVQTDDTAPMTFDGWRAEIRIQTKDLKGYIQSKWLD